MKKKIKDCLWKKWLVFVGLMVLLLGIYPVSMKYITSQKDLEHLKKDDFSFAFQVDKVVNEDKEFVLDGWAFKLEEDATEETLEFWLYDIKEEKIVYPRKTEFKTRSDVNEYFLCEYDYGNSGIVASFNKKKLDLANKDYEVLVSDTNNAKIYQTGTYISNGELVYCSSEQYIHLDVVGTDIEEIVNDGVLRVYRSDYGMYVYQYEDELYWIAESQYDFEDGDTKIHFQTVTTQIEKLSEDRIANNWNWSNYDFQFGSKELIDWNTGKYRVAKARLSTEYSILAIGTGSYTDEWVWQQNFRPWYEFSN